MKRQNIKLWLLFLLPFIGGCTEQKFVFNDPEGAIFFTSSTSTVSVPEEKEVTESLITVGASNLSDVDREFVLRIDVKGLGLEEAKQGEHYDIPNPVIVIPAGEWTGSAKILIYPEFLPKGTDVVAYFSLTNMSDTEFAKYNQTLALYLSRSCKFDINDLIGDYSFTSKIFIPADPTLVRTVKVVKEEGKDNVLRLKSIYGGANDLVFSVAVNELGELEIIAAKQKVITLAAGAYYFEGTGTWNTCLKDKLTFQFDVYEEKKLLESGAMEEFIKK